MNLWPSHFWSCALVTVALAAAPPARAADVSCTFTGTVRNCSVPALNGTTVTGSFAYDPSCAGVMGKHVFNIRDDDQDDSEQRGDKSGDKQYQKEVKFSGCSTLTHRFRYSIDASHTGNYMTGAAYEIDMGTSTFKLVCTTSNGQRCTILLTYKTGQHPPAGGALPTSLSASTFSAMKLTVSTAGTTFDSDITINCP